MLIPLCRANSSRDISGMSHFFLTQPALTVACPETVTPSNPFVNTEYIPSAPRGPLKRTVKGKVTIPSLLRGNTDLSRRVIDNSLTFVLFRSIFKSVNVML